MTHREIIHWLRECDENRLERLWRRADETRRRHVGDAVHLRGLLEISNYCVRQCHYCGLRGQNHDIQRYRMKGDGILACARQAADFGYGTVVMQAGEDYGLSTEFIAKLVRTIKRETNLAVTLSLGERGDDELETWRAAGADRYLLRFETSNEELYERIHPSMPGRKSDRFAILRKLRETGYEVGSGVMIGIPGQTWDDLAEDIRKFAELDLDMIGVGPFIAHPSTPLGSRQHSGGQPSRLPTLSGEARRFADSSADSGVGRYVFRPVQGPAGTWGTAALGCLRSVRGPAATSTDRDGGSDDGGSDNDRCVGEQVPGDELTTYKVIALARLVCPNANIPSTTALATLNKAAGRELGLSRGANVVMPNVTPPEYRCKYEIYPEKACLHETAGQCQLCLKGRIEMMGRTIGFGRGDSPNRRRRLRGAEPMERRVAQ